MLWCGWCVGARGDFCDVQEAGGSFIEEGGGEIRGGGGGGGGWTAGNQSCYLGVRSIKVLDTLC